MEKSPTPQPLKDQIKSTTSQQKRKLATPQELISHYQNQGLDSEQASIKVIEDLQNVLFRLISANNSKSKKDKLSADAARKIDVLNTRIAVLDVKVDSKPGYVETFAIGVASGTALNGICSVLPSVLEGVGQIWSSVRAVTKPSSSS